ncbi:MAG: alpha/beta fold hydrolase [Propionibacteriales bacterium]|nr:alpha/beta fold hydrolase [Propionibacteriales bacterium]
MSSSSAWLRCLRQEPAARFHLLCLPHAGAAADSFVTLAAALSPDVELWAVQYPGRQDRAAEEQLPTAGAIADVVAGAWRDLGRARPFAILGHSMGALVAYETARLLEAHPEEAPARLVVSGQMAPEQHARRRDLPEDDGLLDEVRRLDPGTVLDDALLREHALPALRADYRVLRDYTWEPRPLLRAPLTVLCGDADPLTPLPDAERWLALSVVPGRIRTLEGGHFFLRDHVDTVAALVREDLLESAGRLAG